MYYRLQSCVLEAAILRSKGCSPLRKRGLPESVAVLAFGGVAVEVEEPRSRRAVERCEVLCRGL